MMLRKKLKKSWQKNNIDKALIFSAIMIITFSIVMIITFWKFQLVPDALIIGFFACFSAEGGFLTYLHKLKKEREKTGDMRVGDVTGFDDAEVMDDPDENENEIEEGEGC